MKRPLSFTIVKFYLTQRLHRLKQLKTISGASLFVYSIHWFCIWVYSVRLYYSPFLYQGLRYLFTVSTGSVSGSILIIYSIQCFYQVLLHSLQYPSVLYQGLLCMLKYPLVSTGPVSGPSLFVYSIRWFSIWTYSAHLQDQPALC